MSTHQAHVHHTLDYTEIGVADLDRAKAFYAAAFGWEFNDYGPGYAGIRSSSGVGEVGGLALGAPTGAGGVLAQLWSDDLEASVEAVERAGGTIDKAPFAFPGGRRFSFLDPEGNRLGAWTAAPD